MPYSTFDPKLILFVPPGGVFERAANERGLQIAREVFADRNYMPDGTLVSRSSPDAFVRDPIEAAERVIRMLREQKGARDRRQRCCSYARKPSACMATIRKRSSFVRKLRERLDARGSHDRSAGARK